MQKSHKKYNLFSLISYKYFLPFGQNVTIAGQGTRAIIEQYRILYWYQVSNIGEVKMYTRIYYKSRIISW